MDYAGTLSHDVTGWKLEQGIKTIDHELVVILI